MEVGHLDRVEGIAETMLCKWGRPQARFDQLD